MKENKKKLKDFLDKNKELEETLKELITTAKYAVEKILKQDQHERDLAVLEIGARVDNIDKEYEKLGARQLEIIKIFSELDEEDKRDLERSQASLYSTYSKLQDLITFIKDQLAQRFLH